MISIGTVDVVVSNVEDVFTCKLSVVYNMKTNRIHDFSNTECFIKHIKTDDLIKSSIKIIDNNKWSVYDPFLVEIKCPLVCKYDTVFVSGKQQLVAVTTAQNREIPKMTWSSITKVKDLMSTGKELLFLNSKLWKTNSDKNWSLDKHDEILEHFIVKLGGSKIIADRSYDIYVGYKLSQYSGNGYNFSVAVPSEDKETRKGDSK